MPSLSDVAKDTTSGFLPANTPSMQAAAMAAPFQDASLAAATLVAARDGGLTAEDNAAIDAIEQQIRGIDKVKVVADLGVSQDGQARQALVQAAVVAFTGGPEAKGVVDAIRGTFTGPGVPAGLEVHLTGQLATQVDTVAASGSSESTTSLLSLAVHHRAAAARLPRGACTARDAPAGGIRAGPRRPGHRRVHEDRRPGLLDHPAACSSC